MATRTDRLQAQRESMRNLRVKRIRSGQCPNCGSPRNTVANHCSACLKTDREGKRRKFGLKPWKPGGMGRPRVEAT